MLHSDLLSSAEYSSTLTWTASFQVIFSSLELQVSTLEEEEEEEEEEDALDSSRPCRSTRNSVMEQLRWSRDPGVEDETRLQLDVEAVVVSSPVL